MTDWNLTKVYSDRKHVYTTSVRHQGTTIAFAMDDRRRIRYSVLDLDRAGVPAGSSDAAYWADEPRELSFPVEITEVGFAAAGSTRMPVVKRGGRVEVTGLVEPEDVDPFLSTTARLTALAPFQVLSDGRHLFVFRQSVDAAHPDAVFVLTSGAASGDPARTDYLKPGGTKVAVVDTTLLCDRFVMAGGSLVPLAEVRYRRSRDRVRPDSSLDTPGTADMDGTPFVEPTQELSFIRNLTDGAFAVLLLPTAVAGVSRWQVFARNRATGRIDAFSAEQGADGLFNTQGTILYTSPDDKYKRSVLERAPGKDPFTGKDLVPVIDTSGMAETALRFDGSGHVSLGNPTALRLQGTPYTVEAWIRPTARYGVIVAQRSPGQPSGWGLSIDPAGKLALDQGGTWVTTTRAVEIGADYHHVAAVFDGTNATLYLDGDAAGSGALPPVQPEDVLSVLIGAAGVPGNLGNPFRGDIDEVRIWRRARGADELARDRLHRLVGNEAGLVAYYRFDEGAGSVLHDETDNRLDGSVNGGCTWVTSNAGVGDGPGLSRDSYALAGRTVVSGLAAALYYQQESMPAGYGGEPKPIKKQARVLLACATTGPVPGGDPARAYVAALDFAVGRDGRLAQMPMRVTLPVVTRPDATASQDSVTAVLQRITELQDRLDRNRAVVAAEAPNEREIAFLEEVRYRAAVSGGQLFAYGYGYIRLAEIERKLTDCYAQRARAQQAQVEVAADQAEQGVLRDRLAVLTAGMQGSDDVVIPMPYLGLDRGGLSVYGGLLTFAWTKDAPFILDSATGDVVLYFRGGDGQFFAAYYDTRVVRATKRLGAAGGRGLRLLARDPAIALASVKVTVSAGTAPDRCTVTITDGSSTETFTDVPRQADQLAAVINGTSAAYRSTSATTTLPGVSLAGGSRLVSVDPAGVTDAVPDGAAVDDLAGETCRWHAASPGRAFRFDGQAQRLALAAPDRASVPGDVTVEAWVSPDALGRYGRVLHANTGDARYMLGLSPATAFTSLALNGASDFLDCGPGIRLDSGDFTVELWAQRQALGRYDDILFHGSSIGETDRSLHLGFRDTNVFTFGFWNDDLDTRDAYTDLSFWHHWAAVYIRESRQQILYRDGVEVGRRTAGGDYAGAGNLLIGRSATNFARISVDEVRIWSRARTADQVKATFDRRLTGHESGLLAYWSFAGGQTADLSGHGHDAKRSGQPAVGGMSPLPSYQLIAGVGTTFVRSKDVFPANQWGHVAVAFRQSWALRFDGNACLEVAHDDALNLGGEFTIEVFFQFDGLSAPQTLLHKRAPGTPGYVLGLDTRGLMVFSFTTSSGNVVWGGAADPALQPGTLHRVAVTRKSAGVVDGRPIDRLNFYANGKSVSADWKFDAKQVVSGTAPLAIGRPLGEETGGLRGVLSEVRIWNVALDPSDLGKPVDPKARGLVARWQFPENAGNTTMDATGRYRARLHGATWVRNPDPRASSVQLYHDGALTAAELLEAGDPLVQAGFGQQQFTLGGRTDGGALAEGFAGTLDEVRVWRTARTQREILDNLFTRLDSRSADLVAYYPFDADSTAAGAAVRDFGPRGNDLRAADGQFPRIVLSTAPVSGDIPAVRSALTGLVTAFSEGIGATPAVGEYATVERDSHGGVTGEMKRCYSYLWNGAWHLVTGYKIGNLVSDWVGQAQFDPQLYGYVEGAPPVPSENLTAGGASGDPPDFGGASKVTFTQTDKVTRALHSGWETRAEWAAKVSAEFTETFKDVTVVAPLGVGKAFRLAEVELTQKLTMALEGSNGWTGETNVSQATGITRSSVVSLTGRWEDPSRVRFPGAGRRYVPDNTGFAVVRSDTADVYALRLARNHALVAFRMLPNPDIPRDWNIIPFPINPLYVKQGTLDGAVGYDQQQARAADPDYPMAGTPGEYSYYKPREAYGLKRRIELERHQLRGFYESVSTATGDRPVSGPDRTAQRYQQLLSKMAGEEVDVGGAVAGATSAGPTPSRRNLANTYVWTAAGGFFAETTDTTDMISETSGGSWSLKGTMTFEATFGGKFGFGGADIGIKGGFELSLAGSHSETRTKSTEMEQTFRVDVECSPARDLQQHVDGRAVTDADGRPVLAPGRVDAYRFMTFYLDSAKENFEDFYGKVVDPRWLKESSDAGAVALRQAQQSERRPPCWRILHRVTFVSRVLPAQLPSTAPPVEVAARSVNLASSYELVRRLDPLVRPATTSRSSLADATRSALASLFPALTPKAQQIVDFLALYYGVTS